MAKKPASKPDLRALRPGSRPRSPLETYFSGNAAALELLDEWLELRAKGETPWTMQDIITELTVSYGMPKVGPSSLRSYLDRHRAELYRRGIKQ